MITKNLPAPAPFTKGANREDVPAVNPEKMADAMFSTIGRGFVSMTNPDMSANGRKRFIPGQE